MTSIALRNKPTLETAHLRLRPLSLSDAKRVFAYTSDPQMTEFTLWEPHKEVGESTAFIASVISGTWGLIQKSDEVFVGTCSFIAWDTNNRRAEIAYALGRAYWGRGYMTEAVRAVIDFGFRRMGLNRIEARFVTGNSGSERVLQKVGMTREGLLRQQEFARGRYHDMMMYSILYEEWSR